MLGPSASCVVIVTKCIFFFHLLMLHFLTTFTCSILNVSSIVKVSDTKAINIYLFNPDKADGGIIYAYPLAL